MPISEHNFFFCVLPAFSVADLDEEKGSKPPCAITSG